MSGPVSVDTEYEDLRTGRLLVILVAFLLLLALLRGDVPDAGPLLGSLFPVVLLFVLLGMIYALIFGISPGRYFSSLGRAAGRGARAGARGIARGVQQGGVGVARAASSGYGGSNAFSTPVRRFRVQSDDGQTHACLLVGELRGDDVRQGDRVRVTGRRNKQQQVKVHRVELLATSAGPVVATVEGRLPRGLLLARVVDRAVRVATVVVGAAVGFLLLNWVW